MELYNGHIENKSSSFNHSKEKVCSYCGESSQTEFVSGHEQCEVCKTNVEPCCQGEFSKSSWTKHLDKIGK